MGVWVLKCKESYPHVAKVSHITACRWTVFEVRCWPCIILNSIYASLTLTVKFHFPSEGARPDVPSVTLS